MDNSKNERKERGVREDNSEGMSTEKAIEILYNVTVYNQKSSEFNKFKKEFQNIVNLLIRGKKFEDMWKDALTRHNPSKGEINE